MTGRIAFQGEPGAYSHQACRDAYPGLDPLPCASFQDALAALNPVRSVGSQLREVLIVHRHLAGARLRAESLAWLKRVGVNDAEVIAKRTEDLRRFLETGAM